MTKLHYPIPLIVVLPLALSILQGKRRDFARDARACVARLQPRLSVSGEEHIPKAGPCLITINHYSSPTFRSWWLTLSISATVPHPVRWIIANAWTSPDPWYTRTVSPLSRRVFRRIARVYGFISMPPMPPRPWESASRAKAVRQALDEVRKNPDAILGLAPEGADTQDGVLQCPPPGVGRFMLHLAEKGLAFVPVGIYESEKGLQLNFGAAYRLDIPDRGPGKDELDRQVRRMVMTRISILLPDSLRGEFN